ncbi:MAG: RHS repeat domain-containing protein [Blastocatellia bacterium]
MSYATNGTGAPLNNRINNAGYDYDAAGNMTNAGSYAYDAASRLKTAAGGNSYDYDGDGNRVKQTNGSGTVYYLWSSLLGEPVAELTSGGLYRAHVYGPGGGQMIAMQSYDGGFYWAHTDHLGSGRKLTNTSGTVVYRGEFDPHGQSLYEWHATGQTYLNSHKYTGYERDWATNLDNAKARTFNHNRGRFMQPDPLGLGAADVTDPQSLNLYSYVRNDPANFTDPTGLYLPGPGLDPQPDFSFFWSRFLDMWDMPLVPYEPPTSDPSGPSEPEPQKEPIQKSNFLDCFEKYRFTSTVGGFFGDTAKSIATAIDTTSTISIAGDLLATAVKASGKTLGTPQPYASGLNWVFRRISSGSVRGVLTSIGNRVTPVLAVTGAFTASYDVTIAAQCASGLLK